MCSPPHVDDGRTPGRKAGWTDGLTDEERADRDFYDPKADDDDERWVVENLKHAAITAASSPGHGQLCQQENFVPVQQPLLYTHARACIPYFDDALRSLTQDPHQNRPHVFHLHEAG